MILDDPDDTQCIVYAALTSGGAALPSGHVFAAGDAKLFFADATSANATNLPVAVAGAAPGTFKVQIARPQRQIRGDMLLQIASGTVDTWNVVIPVDFAPVKAGDPMTLTSGERTADDAALLDAATAGHTTTGSVGAALAAAAAGGGGGGGTVDPTAIAQAIWQLPRVGNQPAGSFGELLDARISTAGIALQSAPNVPPLVGAPTLYAGDTAPALQMTAFTDGLRADLTTATALSMRWNRPDGTTATVPVIPVNTARGDVQHVWQPGETAQVGIHKAQIVATWPGGGTQTFEAVYTWIVLAAL